LFSLQSELAILIGVLSLTARILLLLAGLLAAALLLLAGLLTRVRSLLTRVLILSAHSGISLARGSLGQPPNPPLVAKERCSRVIIPWHPSGVSMAAGTGDKTTLYKTFKPQRMLLPPPGSTVRKWHDASFRLPGPSPRRFIKRQRMDYFAQQLINGLVLGSIYGLIAIGYTMVYGIVGMINFAHGDIFMIGGFIALISFLVLVSFGLTAVPVILLIVLLVSMAITALYGWTVERIAYRPLRHSFRLAPMLSAIGMSFVLTNYSQIAQGARVKPVPPIITGGYTLHEGAGGFVVQLSNVQIIVVITTVVLLALFTWLVARTRLGRDMRACEQDQTMAALLGVDVDRTISMTFVIGAALAAVAGMMYLLYYGLVDFFMGFVAGIKAFTAAVLGGIGSLPGAMLGGLAIGLIETFWSAYFSVEYKDVAAFSILIVVLIFLPTGLLGRPEVEKV
jgi:branched-chain amino acid transport system permease protein